MSKIDNEIFKFVVSFHMKSGKCFYVYCDECDITHTGGKVTGYTTSGQDPRFKLIDLTEIECVLMADWNKRRGDLVK